jgi:hypothetical protein
MSKNFENGYISIIFAKNENLLRVSENRTSLDDVREKKGILVFQPKSQLTTSRSKTSFFIVAKSLSCILHKIGLCFAIFAVCRTLKFQIL